MASAVSGNVAGYGFFPTDYTLTNSTFIYQFKASSTFSTWPSQTEILLLLSFVSSLVSQSKTWPAPRSHYKIDKAASDLQGRERERGRGEKVEVDRFRSVRARRPQLSRTEKELHDKVVWW
jgi:hypothetical protein